MVDKATIIVSIITIIMSMITAAITSIAAFLIQERRLRRDFELDREKLRTEFMAEQVARKLLESEKWKKRSFKEIKKRLGGFNDDDLRKILVRAGAVRFEGDDELWGLLSRTRMIFDLGELDIVYITADKNIIRQKYYWA